MIFKSSSSKDDATILKAQNNRTKRVIKTQSQLSVGDVWKATICFYEKMSERVGNPAVEKMS